MTFVVEEHIDADPKLVWRHLTTPALMARWMPGISNLRADDDGPLKSGSSLKFQARGSERSSDVTECRTGEALALRSTQGPITATYTYAVAADGAGTHVTLTIDCVARGPVRVIAPVIRAMMRRAEASHLSRLGQAVTASKV